MNVVFGTLKVRKTTFTRKAGTTTGLTAGRGVWHDRLVGRTWSGRVGAVIAALTLAAVSLTGCGPSFDGLHLRIAAGNSGGVYDKLGQTLADAWAADLGIDRPEVLKTQGSPDNVERVLSGGAEVAFVAADVAADRAAAKPGLAALARIHDDYLHIVVRADSDITKVDQLRGRTIGIGSPSSGVEYIAARLLTVAGLDNTVKKQNLGLDESVAKLLAGQIDAFFWSGGLPTPSIANHNEQSTINGKSSLRLLDIADLMPKVQDASKVYSQVYGTATIPASTYNQPEPVTTLVVPNFLVVPASMSADVAEALVRGLFDARQQLAVANPAALSIDVRPGIETQPIPLHPGALRYYRAQKTS